MTVVSLIVIIIAIGFVAWLVSVAPFVEKTHKKFIVSVLMGISIFMVLMFSLSLFEDGRITEIPMI